MENPREQTHHRGDTYIGTCTSACAALCGFAGGGKRRGTEADPTVTGCCHGGSEVGMCPRQHVPAWQQLSVRNCGEVVGTVTCGYRRHHRTAEQKVRPFTMPSFPFL